MQREILFRGLKADGSGELVYGNLLQSEITANGTCRCAIAEKFADDYIIKVHQVIPETVGQFVNNYDKNETRIFQHDYDADGNMVTWCDKCNGWEFAHIEIPTKDVLIPCHRCDGNFFFEDHVNDFEVIGNIHQK